MYRNQEARCTSNFQTTAHSTQSTELLGLFHSQIFCLRIASKSRRTGQLFLSLIQNLDALNKIYFCCRIYLLFLPDENIFIPKNSGFVSLKWAIYWAFGKENGANILLIPSNYGTVYQSSYHILKMLSMDQSALFAICK
jgi:hypothetical protein